MAYIRVKAGSAFTEAAVRHALDGSQFAVRNFERTKRTWADVLKEVGG